MSTSPSRRIRIFAALLVTALGLPAAGSAVATSGDSAESPPHISGHRTTPVYSYEDAIWETVYVDAGQDTDADGESDRVAVDVVRPKEAAESGHDLPVIVTTSPYNSVIPGTHSSMRGAFDENFNRLTAPTEWLDNYFVPRGYAVAFVDAPGTFRSTGCHDYFGGPREVQGVRKVVEWLTGLGEAQTHDGKPTAAGWSSGQVGMIGHSASGINAIGVAATGVKGLETIVPSGAGGDLYLDNSSSGDPGGGHVLEMVKGSNGDQVPSPDPYCRETALPALAARAEDPRYVRNAFWDERTAIRSAANIRASVFQMHGVSDDRVSMQNATSWWKAIAARDVPRRLLVHPLGHQNWHAVDPSVHERLGEWFDYWLHDLDNGVMSTHPEVTVIGGDGERKEYSTWPHPKAKEVTLKLGNTEGATAGTLTSASRPKADRDVLVRGESAVSPKDLTKHRDTQAVFVSNPLGHEVTVSGDLSLTVRHKSTQPETAIHVQAFKVGKERRYLDAGYMDGEELCVGSASETDRHCVPKQDQYFAEVDDWSLTGTSAKRPTQLSVDDRTMRPHRPDVWSTSSFTIGTGEEVISKGQRIVLVVRVAPGGARTPAAEHELLIDPKKSSLTVPIKGRARSLR
ncbi:CocE/NonD family hydrolase [Demetria terragena]|uniref:CocE/NonD family hydrolase n=1 Tax=Demetria terragena TaxID=63959 RepID=UPI00039F15B3|nr:CocE/NonD family hydrolase [Demetria terragena]